MGLAFGSHYRRIATTIRKEDLQWKICGLRMVYGLLRLDPLGKEPLR